MLNVIAVNIQPSVKRLYSKLQAAHLVSHGNVIHLHSLQKFKNLFPWITFLYKLKLVVIVTLPLDKTWERENVICRLYDIITYSSVLF